jgi:hypothetical protein
MMELNAILCPQAPDPRGRSYMIFAFFSLIPNAFADQERATAAAVMAIFQWNQQLVQQRTDAMMAPVLAQMQRNWDEMEGALVRGNERIADGIRQTGANATARMKELQRNTTYRTGAFSNTRKTFPATGKASAITSWIRPSFGMCKTPTPMPRFGIVRPSSGRRRIRIASRKCLPRNISRVRIFEVRRKDNIGSG